MKSGPFVYIRFHGTISRQNAERLVMAAGEGSFLTRESRGNQRGNYAVSLRYFHNLVESSKRQPHKMSDINNLSDFPEEPSEYV